MEKSSIILPVVHHNLTRGRSYFGGPFSKVDVILPSLSPKIHPSSVVKRLERKSKGSILIFDNTDSQTASKLLETETIASGNTSQVKDYLTLRDSPLRRRKIGAHELRNSSKGSIEAVETRRSKVLKIPKLDSYLTYLGSAATENVTSFASRMREKHVITKELTVSSKDDSFGSNRSIIEDILPSGLKSPTQEKNELNSSPKDPTYLDLSPKLQNLSPKTSSPKNSDNSNQSREKFRRMYSKSKTKKFLSIEDFKDDEKRAMDLAQEIVSNYRIYIKNSAKNKELQTQMLKQMEEQGVLPVFHAKVFKQLPLNLRIFNDTTESIEIEVLIPKSNKPQQGNTPSTPAKRKLNTKKTQSILKIIPAKFEAYKNINKELIELNTKFKVQGLQILEGRLIQAHDDFIKKKKEVLRNVSKTDAKKYNDLKVQCQNVENILWLCEGYVLEEQFGPENPESETIMINKELENVMNTWKKTLVEKKQ